MRSLRAWLQRLGGLFGKARRDRELADEIESHLQLHIDDNIRAGMTPEEARREAILRFGPVESIKESYRDRRGIPWLETFSKDLAWSLRVLWREPAFALVAVVTLALGIGANATAFGVVDALLFRPPAGVGEPDDLYRVRLLPLPPDSEWPRRAVAAASYPEYEDLRDHSGALAELAAYSSGLAIYGYGAEAREIRTLEASANYFTTLRVRPELGSLWVAGNESADDAVVVLSYDFWQRELGGDPDVIGRTIEVSARPLTVLGVTPPHFRGVDLDNVDIWLPINTASGAASAEQLAMRNIFWLWMVGRPAPDVTPEAAAQRTTEVFIALAQANPPEAQANFETAYDPARVQLVPVSDYFFGEDDNSPVPAWLLAVTAVVLVIACANCSNLLLARGARRRRELAVRAAMGASRGRLARLLLTESLLLAALGGGGGVILALVSSRFLYLFDLPPLDPVIDARVLLFSLAVALATSLLVGLWPAVRLPRAGLEAELKAATPRASHDRSRVRAALTVVQVALSIVLLINAGLFVRSLRNVRSIDAGFDFERLLVVSMRFERGTALEHVHATKEEALTRFRTLPGVVSVALTGAAPYGSGWSMSNLNGETWGLPGGEPMLVASLHVGPGYFRTMGLPLRAGRSFSNADRARSGSVLMINEEMARRMGGEDAALGRCIAGRDGCSTIIGIVADARFSQPVEEPLPAVYEPLSEDANSYSTRRAVLLLRTGDETARLANLIRELLMQQDPAVQFVEVESVADLLAPKLQPWRIATTIFTLFGSLALLLATIGLYSVVAYLVAARRPEIGIRMALGASRGRIRQLVLGEGTRLAALGGALGLALAVGVARLLEHRMYSVQPTDPLTYALVTLLMLGAALAASFVSAERASRVDPNVVLRND